MKCLILIGTCSENPYPEFKDIGERTWNSIDHDKIETAYYIGGGKNTWNGNTFECDCDESYMNQHIKFRLALKAMLELDWEIMFRAGVTSYINKNLLYKRIQTLNRNYKGVYAGTLLGSELPLFEFEGQQIKGDFLSGAGIFFCRKTAECLAEHIPDEVSVPEDMVIGHVLHRRGFYVSEAMQERVDVNDYSHKNAYHYRFHTDQRSEDLKRVKYIHDIILIKNE